MVVVGTGAGGAPMAKALAERGHAVLLVEEGAHFTRARLQRPRRADDEASCTATGRRDRRRSATPPSRCPIGRGVGGTTPINSGTCFRVPERRCSRRGATTGLHELHRRRARRRTTKRSRRCIGVAPAPPRRSAAPREHHRARLRRARLLAPRAAAQRAGLRRPGPVLLRLPHRRQALAPTSRTCRWRSSAARSSLTGLRRSTKVLIEGDAAVGVDGRARPRADGADALTVRARVVVLACGTLYTPALLRAQRARATRPGSSGRNLSIHPASARWAVFDEERRRLRARSRRATPSTSSATRASCFEGAHVPLDLTAGVAQPATGRAFVVADGAVQPQLSASASW